MAGLRERIISPNRRRPSSFVLGRMDSEINIALYDISLDDMTSRAL